MEFRPVRRAGEAAQDVGRAKLTIDDTVPVSVEDDIASGATRLEVAPNPFRSQASIGFTLPRAGVAKLTLHDLQGREIARLADGEFAAGGHAVTLGNARLRPGVYLLRLDAAGARQVRRIAFTP